MGWWAEPKRGWRPGRRTARVILEYDALGGDRAVAGAAGLDPSSNPWWSDASNDPWRDPSSPAVIVSRGEPEPPPAEPVVEVPAASNMSTARLVVLVALITGLLAGALGGALGYVAAVKRAGPNVVIGAGSSAPPQRPSDSLAGLIARVMPSVVTVQGTTAQGVSLGSGFVISSLGYILTNEHVVSDVPDQGVTVTFSDSSSVSGRVVGRDPESDIAVIKVDRPNLTPVALANSDQVAVGDSVFAIGSPLALSGTVTAGIVSALDRTIETQDVGGVTRYYAAIQTDAAINRGNSGGPLFDLAGRVIGMNSVIKSMSADDGEDGGNIGIAFAIPSNQATRIATDIIDSGKPRRTVIGAELGSSPAAGGGVVLSRVDSGGPAAAAGLQAGDVVTRLGSHPVMDSADVIALVRSLAPGTVVNVTYRRGTEVQTASVTLVADAN
jgi:putative serine protease PepD